jgi:hypothetical protein
LRLWPPQPPHYTLLTSGLPSLAWAVCSAAVVDKTVEEGVVRYKSERSPGRQERRIDEDSEISEHTVNIASWRRFIHALPCSRPVLSTHLILCSGYCVVGRTLVYKDKPEGFSVVHSDGSQGEWDDIKPDFRPREKFGSFILRVTHFLAEGAWLRVKRLKSIPYSHGSFRSQLLLLV